LREYRSSIPKFIFFVAPMLLVGSDNLTELLSKVLPSFEERLKVSPDEVDCRETLVECLRITTAGGKQLSNI